MRSVQILIFVGMLVVGISRAWAQTNADAALRDPTHACELTKQALDLLRQGEDSTSAGEKVRLYSEGERLARAAVELDDDSADAHFAVFANHGRRLLAAGFGANPLRLLELNRELDRCLQLNPDHADALAARGGLYRQLPTLLGGSLSKAEQYLTRAISLDDHAVGARIELAQTCRALGQRQRAVELLHKAAYWAEHEGKPRQLHEARSLLNELGQ